MSLSYTVVGKACEYSLQRNSIHAVHLHNLNIVAIKSSRGGGEREPFSSNLLILGPEKSIGPFSLLFGNPGLVEDILPVLIIILSGCSGNQVQWLYNERETK